MDGQPKIVYGDDDSSLEEIVDTPLSRQKIPNDESSCTITMENCFCKEFFYDPNHPHKIYHEDHLVTMMPHAYTPLYMVEGEGFRRMVTHLDPYIRPITRSKLTRTLIPQKLN